MAKRYDNVVYISGESMDRAINIRVEKGLDKVRVNVKSGVWHDQATLLFDCSCTNSPSTNGTLLTTKVNNLNP